MPLSSQYASNRALVNCVPLSVMILLRTPNRETIPRRNLTADLWSILVTAEASGHLVNLSMVT